MVFLCVLYSPITPFFLYKLTRLSPFPFLMKPSSTLGHKTQKWQGIKNFTFLIYRKILKHIKIRYSKEHVLFSEYCFQIDNGDIGCLCVYVSWFLIIGVKMPLTDKCRVKCWLTDLRFFRNFVNVCPLQKSLIN